VTEQSKNKFYWTEGVTRKEVETALGSYVVIFASVRATEDQAGYAAMATEMERLARAQPGFIEMQSVRSPDGTGLTVCYWESAAAIACWKQDVDHTAAQRQGKEKWYLDYRVTIARVERSYGSAVK
jgi:heme-degrading monooxygenase HmoA